MMLTLRRRDELVCREVVELVNDYLEEVMSRRDRRRFERHIRPETIAEYVARHFTLVYRERGQ